MKRFSLTRNERIRKPTDYLRIQRTGDRIVSNHFVFFFAENHVSIPRIGLIVSRKVGNAVVRNRVKRLIRQAFRQHKETVSGNVDVLVLAKPSAATLVYTDFVQAFTELGKTLSFGCKPKEKHS